MMASKLYSLVLSRFYIGQHPGVMVADLEMIKHVMVKEFNSFVDREVSGIPHSTRTCSTVLIANTGKNYQWIVHCAPHSQNVGWELNLVDLQAHCKTKFCMDVTM